MSAPSLTDFLLARIAEDEAVAREASVGHVWTWDDRGDELMSDHTYPVGTMTGRECIIDTEGANPPDPDKAGAHIARHDPARILAECVAKRRIVEAHGDGGWSQGYTDDGYGGHDHACETCGTFGEYGEPWPCPTLRALALPYADHPDYREEWAP